MAVADAVTAPPAGTALLVCTAGPAAGQRFMLDRDLITVGRHADSGIVLDHVTVSRHHAQFQRDAAAFAVHDVGSLNGTYVNRQPVHIATLGCGDEVQIGVFRFLYRTSPDPDEPAGGGLTDLGASDHR